MIRMKYIYFLFTNSFRINSISKMKQPRVILILCSIILLLEYNFIFCLNIPKSNANNILRNQINFKNLPNSQVKDQAKTRQKRSINNKKLIEFQDKEQENYNQNFKNLKSDITDPRYLKNTFKNIGVHLKDKLSIIFNDYHDKNIAKIITDLGKADFKIENVKNMLKELKNIEISSDKERSMKETAMKELNAALMTMEAKLRGQNDSSEESESGSGSKEDISIEQNVRQHVNGKNIYGSKNIKDFSKSILNFGSNLGKIGQYTKDNTNGLIDKALDKSKTFLKKQLKSTYRSLDDVLFGKESLKQKVFEILLHHFAKFEKNAEFDLKEIAEEIITLLKSPQSMNEICQERTGSMKNTQQPSRRVYRNVFPVNSNSFGLKHQIFEILFVYFGLIEKNNPESINIMVITNEIMDTIMYARNLEEICRRWTRRTNFPHEHSSNPVEKKYHNYETLKKNQQILGSQTELKEESINQELKIKIFEVLFHYFGKFEKMDTSINLRYITNEILNFLDQPHFQKEICRNYIEELRNIKFLYEKNSEAVLHENFKPELEAAFRPNKPIMETLDNPFQKAESDSQVIFRDSLRNDENKPVPPSIKTSNLYKNHGRDDRILDFNDKNINANSLITNKNFFQDHANLLKTLTEQNFNKIRENIQSKLPVKLLPALHKTEARTNEDNVGGERFVLLGEDLKIPLLARKKGDGTLRLGIDYEKLEMDCNEKKLIDSQENGQDLISSYRKHYESTKHGGYLDNSKIPPFYKTKTENSVNESSEDEVIHQITDSSETEKNSSMYQPGDIYKLSYDKLLKIAEKISHKIGPNMIDNYHKIYKYVTNLGKKELQKLFRHITSNVEDDLLENYRNNRHKDGMATETEENSYFDLRKTPQNSNEFYPSSKTSYPAGTYHQYLNKNGNSKENRQFESQIEHPHYPNRFDQHERDGQYLAHRKQPHFNSEDIKNNFRNEENLDDSQMRKMKNFDNVSNSQDVKDFRVDMRRNYGETDFHLNHIKEENNLSSKGKYPKTESYVQDKRMFGINQYGEYEGGKYAQHEDQ